MVKRFVIALALVALIILPASQMAAQEKEVKVTVTAGDDESAVCGGMMPKLTDEQREKIERLREEQRLTGIELRADLQKLGVELKREMNKPDPDMKAVESVLKKMSAVRERMQMGRIEHNLAMRKLLGDNWRAHMSLGRGDGEMLWIEADAEDAESDSHVERDMRVYRMRGDDRSSRGREGRMRMMRSRSGGFMQGCCPSVRMMRGGNTPCCAHGGGMMMMKEGHECTAECAHGGGMMMMKKGHECTAECAHGGGMMMRGGCAPKMAGGCASGGAAMMKCSAAGRATCTGKCSPHKSSWEARMFRPRGKKTEAHRCTGECKSMQMKGMPAESCRMKAAGGK